MQAQSIVISRRLLAAAVAISILATVPQFTAAVGESITGTVVTEDGRPVEGARVFRVMAGGEAGAQLVPTGASTLTGADGRFSLTVRSDTVGTAALTDSQAGLLLDEDASQKITIPLHDIDTDPGAGTEEGLLDNIPVLAPPSKDLAPWESEEQATRPEVGYLTSKAPARTSGVLLNTSAGVLSVAASSTGSVTSAVPASPAIGGGGIGVGVFTLRVGDSYTPWTVFAPFPADVDEDGVVDSTIRITPGPDQSMCMQFDYVLSGSGSHGFVIGVISDGIEFTVGGRSIPDSYTLCVTPGSAASASFEALNPRGDLWFDLSATGVSFSAALSEMPGRFALAPTYVAAPIGSDTYALDYSSDRTNTLRLEFTSPVTALVEIDELPERLTGEFHRIAEVIQAPLIAERMGLQYNAAHSIPRLVVQFGTSTDARLAQVALRELPSYYNGGVEWERYDDKVMYAAYNHSASSTVGSLAIRAGSVDDELTLGLQYLPAKIDHARFERDGTDLSPTFRVSHAASTPVWNAWAEFGVNGAFDHTIFTAPVLPATLDAEVRMLTDRASLQELRYSHVASSAVPSVGFVGSYGGGEFTVDARAYDVPASAAAIVRVQPAPGASVAPSFNYVGSASGLSLHAKVAGWGLGAGAFVEAHLVGVPARVTTSLAKTSDGFQLDVDTHDSGSLKYLDLEANLPKLLKDLPVSDFRVYAENLRHLDLLFANVRDDTLQCGVVSLAVECHRFVARDVDYVAIYHGTLLLHLPGSTIALGLDFFGQQLDWYWDRYCGCFRQQWTTKYAVSEPDWSIMDPTFFDTGKTVRLLGRL